MTEAVRRFGVQSMATALDEAECPGIVDARWERSCRETIRLVHGDCRVPIYPTLRIEEKRTPGDITVRARGLAAHVGAL